MSPENMEYDMKNDIKRILICFIFLFLFGLDHIAHTKVAYKPVEIEVPSCH